VVVDDGSGDASAEIARAASETDDRVRALVLDRNQGRSTARNTGLDAARGEWIGVVDADDLIAPDRIEHLLWAASRFDGTNLVTDDRIGWFLDDDGVVQLTHRAPGRRTWQVGPPHPLDERRHFADSFGQCDFLVRRSLLEQSGVRYPPDMDIAEDLTVSNGLLFHPACRAVRDARAGYYYRLGPTTRCAGGAEAHIEMVARIDRPRLTEVHRRWQPAHSWLLERSDRTFAAEGRLLPDRFPTGSTAPTPKASHGLPVLVGIKALQWMSRWSDRATRPAIRDDIARQLRDAA
jgi:hypothetical protein